MKFPRKKGRNALLSFFYKFDKILPFSRSGKLKLYLNLAWIFERLAHEQSFKVYSPAEHPVRHLSTSFLLEQLDATHEVLDLGCNTGDLTFLLSKKVKSITGIDYDPELIRQANKKYGGSGISFINDEATTYLSKRNQKFDVLILSHILEHLDSPGALLDACKTRVRYVYIEVPDIERTHLNVYREKLNAGLMYTDVDHVWEFDRNDLQALILNHGLLIEASEFKWGVQKYWCSVSQS